MPFPPLAFTDASLLFGVSALILLITYELSSSHYGITNLVIDKKKLRLAAFSTSLLFLITVAIRIMGVVLT